jgi:SAM-dependent methyltransferase
MLRARSFGIAAEHYERGRPVWPAAALDAAEVPVDSHVLDLAAGTGKLTRVLVERFERVTAVEPDDAMRALNRWGEALAGSAESIPLADASVDAVFVADAFHWFSERPAVIEMARVLRPGGRLVILWSQRNGDASPALPAVDELFDRIRPTTPEGWSANRFFAGEWRTVFHGAPFSELRERSFEHEHVLDRGGLISFLLSQSMIAARPSEERDEIAAELERIVPEARHVIPFLIETHTTRRMG